MADPTVTGILQQGIETAKAGNQLLARMHLSQAVELAPNDPNCWLWLAWVADSPLSAVHSLQRILDQHPDHKIALAGLKWAQAMADFELAEDVSEDTSEFEETGHAFAHDWTSKTETWLQDDSDDFSVSQDEVSQDEVPQDESWQQNESQPQDEQGEWGELEQREAEQFGEIAERDDTEQQADSVDVEVREHLTGVELSEASGDDSCERHPDTRLDETETFETKADEFTSDAPESADFAIDEPSTLDFETTDLEADDFETGDLEAGEFETVDLEADDFETVSLEAGDFEAGDFKAGDFETIDLEADEFEADDSATIG
jgi:hypothetical protein